MTKSSINSVFAPLTAHAIRFTAVYFSSLAINGDVVKTERQQTKENCANANKILILVCALAKIEAHYVTSREI